MRTQLKVGFVVITALAVATVGSAGNDLHARPFWGSVSGPVTFVDNGVCNDITGATWQTMWAATGNLTHLGRTEVQGAHCSTPDGAFAVGGEATLTAANGDEVSLTYTGTTVYFSMEEGLVVQEVKYIITGGTGRFEGASGFLQGMVYARFEDYFDPEWALEMFFAGIIIY